MYVYVVQMQQIMNKSRAVVFTGHSVGGTIASLTALWFLSRMSKISSSSSPSPLAVLCITFGSPMLGNESFSRAILENRWSGNFLHVVAQDDIVPSLLFAPLLPPLTQQQLPNYLLPVVDDDVTAQRVFRTVLASLEALSVAGGGSSNERQVISQFWPFGSYMFCTRSGAICLDPAMAVVKLLYVMLAKGSPSSSVLNHHNYEQYIGLVHWQFLTRTSFDGNNLAEESNNDAGVALALQASGIINAADLEGSISELAKESLELTKQGLRRNLNSAKLTAELLCHTKTLRVQIEWYKAFCDLESSGQMGYYDSFKSRGASRRDNKVNMNRLKLASLWNNVIKMLETNQLPRDFHKQSRWVNASQFYKLLIEPLDIAEYYRNGLHHKKGHYLDYGREKRYKIFDQWWRDSDDSDNKKRRTTRRRNEFASLTQDSCFWARVEEARDWVNQIRTMITAAEKQNDDDVLVLVDKISKFEEYAKKLIEIQEVSKDVLAINSSYMLFVRDWTQIKSSSQTLRLQLFGPSPQLIN